MKKNILLILFIICFVCLPVAARSNKGKTVYVSVESIESKDKPSFWGGDRDTFYYGDQVEIIGENKSWYNVKSTVTGKSGWLKDTAVTTKKIKAGKKVSVNANEIALAGKGFASPIEAEYGSMYNLDYDIVDEIEEDEISDLELKTFIDEGELTGGDNER